MTLKSSSPKQFLAMFRQSMKQTIVLPVLAFICLVFFSLLEFSNTFYYSNSERYLFFWDELRLGFGFSEIADLCFIAAGLINAMLVFNFTWSKKHCNVIFSLGMSRRDIYFAKLLGGLVPMISAIIVAASIETLSCIISGLTPDSRFFAMAALTVLQYIAVYTLAFVLSSAVISNTGNVVESLIFIIILAFIGTVAEMFIEYSFWDFTHGASSSNLIPSVTDAKFNWSNPFYVFYGYYDSSFMEYYFQSDYKLTLNHWSGTICALSYSVVTALLGYLGFRRRRNEISGTWGRAKALNEIVAAVLGFYAATACTFGIPGTSHGNGGFHTYIIAVITFLVTYIITKLVFGYKRKKEIKLALKVFPAYATGFAAIFLVFSSGLFGYSSYIPEKSEIASVTVTTPHLIFMDDTLSGASSFALYQQNIRETYVASVDDLLFYSGYHYEDAMGIIFRSDEDIEKAIKLHKKLIDDGKIKNNAADAVGTSLAISYTLKDGSTVKRYYTESTENAIIQLLYLNDTQPVKDTLQDYANIDLDLERFREVNSDGYPDEYYEYETEFYNDDNDYITRNDFLDISHTYGLYNFNKANYLAVSQCYLFPKDMSGAHNIGLADKELYQAILTDIRNTTADQYFHHSAADEIGVISFGLSESVNVYYDDGTCQPNGYSNGDLCTTSWNINSYDIKAVVLTKDMKNTIRYLEENDLMKYFEPHRSVEDIKHVKLATMSELYGENKKSSNYPVFYSAYWTGEYMNIYMRDLGKYIEYPFGRISYKITDKDKIQSLLDDSVVHGFCSNESKIMEITYNDGSVSTVMIPAGSASIK